MSSFVTGPERSVAGKMTRSGLDTRRSRPRALMMVMSDAGMPSSSTGTTGVLASRALLRRSGAEAIRAKQGTMIPPDRPIRALRNWTTFVADASAMAALWATGFALPVKACLSALLVLGMSWILGRYVGRRAEFQRMLPRIEGLENEVQELRGRLSRQCDDAISQCSAGTVRNDQLESTRRVIGEDWFRTTRLIGR